jgi:hypothetical protein
MTNAEKIAKWESLWATYVAKLARLDDLRAAGRYGYQLSQPKVAVKIAADAIKNFDREHAQHIIIFHSGREVGGSVVWEGV